MAHMLPRKEYHLVQSIWHLSEDRRELLTAFSDVAGQWLSDEWLFQPIKVFIYCERAFGAIQRQTPCLPCNVTMYFRSKLCLYRFRCASLNIIVFQTGCLCSILQRPAYLFDGRHAHTHTHTPSSRLSGTFTALIYALVLGLQALAHFAVGAPSHIPQMCICERTLKCCTHAITRPANAWLPAHAAARVSTKS